MPVIAAEAIVAGLLNAPLNGISAKKLADGTKCCVCIVVAGGYVDDEFEINEIQYTGACTDAGPMQPNPVSWGHRLTAVGRLHPRAVRRWNTRRGQEQLPRRQETDRRPGDEARQPSPSS